VTKVRLATVKETGERYLVMRLHLPRDPADPAKVYCWGEVAKTKGRRTTHGPARLFLRDEVEVVEVEKTDELMHRLWMQYIRKLRAEGHDIEVHQTRAGNWHATDRTGRAAL